MRAARENPSLLIPVYLRMSEKPAGYVALERARQWKRIGIAVGADRSGAIRLIIDEMPTPSGKMSPESRRIIAIAMAKYRCKCQGGLVSPR